MKKNRLLNCIVCLIGIVFICVSSVSHAQDNTLSSPVSAAEEAVFTRDHLQTLKAGTQLQYQFTKRGSLEAALNDSATVQITKVGNSGREVLVQCLNGERNIELPLEGELKGNPLIMCFLERDIREMKRLTGGSVSYYRKRLRMALAEDAQITQSKLTWAGKPITATQILIDPYSKDQARVRFTKYANKTYRFVLSDEVPGGVVELQSLMHEDGKSSSVMVEEKFALKK